MNIGKAKIQIENAVKAYLTRDELGDYVIPVEKQRPVLLIGPPGIGKTAVMEQIASDLGIGILVYSMTHHTRQSAIGLPFISRKTYDGVEYDVTEYTMSEIIASIYDLMEETGIREGILFLDEINCVSETLAPLMLQLLQYKVFGRHRIPDGWIITAAGNPPEYNDSVREFDIVTLDRLKKIDVEPDYEAWKHYAAGAGVHPAVTAFLDARRNRFYSVETTVSGRRIVTPRGWEDLSGMLYLYERNGIEADKDLMIQYLQDPVTASEFAVYYDLYRKYQSEYPAAEILSGSCREEIRARARDAGFDEVYSLIGLLLKAVKDDARRFMAGYHALDRLKRYIKEYRERANALSETAADKSAGMPRISPKLSPSESMAKIADEVRQAGTAGARAGSISRGERQILKNAAEMLSVLAAAAAAASDYESSYGIIRSKYAEMAAARSEEMLSVRGKISALIRFAEECWGDGREMTLIVTELTADPDCVDFIYRFGCDEYFSHNSSLLTGDRQREIDARLAELDL